MTRDTVLEILKRSPAFEGTKNTFRIADGHLASFYLGPPGQAIVVTGVKSVELTESVIELESQDFGRMYALYDFVFAVAVRTHDQQATRRAGFD